jgi:hypothetical protein
MRSNRGVIGAAVLAAVAAAVPACVGDDGTVDDGTLGTAGAALAAEWDDTYDEVGGDDFVRGVGIGLSGAVSAVATVYPTPPLPPYAWVRRYAPEGTVAWTTEFKGTGDAVDVTTGGSTIVGGWMVFEGVTLTKGFYVRSYSTTGAIQWTTPVWATVPAPCGAQMADLAVNRDGSVAWAASYQKETAWYWAVGKVAANGAFLWRKEYAGARVVQPLAVAVVPGSTATIAVAGQDGTGEGSRGWIRKYDSAGNALVNFVVPQALAVTDVVLDVSGVATFTARSTLGPGGATIGTLGRLAADWGAVAWTLPADDPTQRFNSLAVDTLGAIHVTGSVVPPGGSQDLLVRSYSPALVPTGSLVFAGSAGAPDYGHRIAHAGGRLAVAGGLRNAGSGLDVYVVRLLP